MNLKRLLSCIISLSLFLPVSGQMKSLGKATADLSKDAVKGRYSGLYVKPDGNAEIFWLHSEGSYGYKFGADGKFKGESSDNEVVSDLNNMYDAENSTAEYAALPTYKGDVIAGSSSWTGTLRIKKGPLSLDADDKFIYGINWEDEHTYKPKAEDTWRSVEIGYRAYSPYKSVVLKSHGKQAKFTFRELGDLVYAPASGSIQAAAMITEKVSIKNPPPYLGNRLVVFSIPGDEPDSMTNNIVIMPYSMSGAGVGLTADDNFAVMMMPLNAPSTYKPVKHLRAPEEMRNHCFICIFDENNNLVDSASFASSTTFTRFQYMNDGNNDFIFGFGNEKSKNWYWKLTVEEIDMMQFIKFDKDHNVAFHKVYGPDEIESKLIVPGAKKNKFKMKFTNGPDWKELKKLDNGNYFLYGESLYYSHAALIASNGDLIHYYVINRGEPGKVAKYRYMMHIRNNNVYLAISDQPHALHNDVDTKTSSTTYSGAYVSTTVTTTRTTQLFEIFHITQLLKIDGNSGDAEQMWLGEQGKEYYTMGNQPVTFADDAICTAGREKGPKGKTIYFEKISY